MSRRSTEPEKPLIAIFRKFVHKYHRLEIKGIENIPSGAAIIAPNHSGAMDWDTICLSCAMERRVHVLYWDKYYYASGWGEFIRNFGVIPLSLERGLDEGLRDLLMEEYFKKGKLVCIFPEGTSATLFEGYKVGKFYPGVVRLAEFSGAPIIPTAITGLVEAAPILFYTARDSKGVRDPPFALPIIFPKKVRIKFGSPIFLEHRKRGKDEYYRLAGKVREEVVRLLRSA